MESVLIEATAALPSQPAGIHHLDEQRAGAIFRIAEPVFEYAHDVEADVQADEIREREWAHGMRHAELEDFVHRFRSRHTFHHREHSLIDEWHQHAIGDKAGSVVHLYGRLLELDGKVARGVISR